MLIERENCPQWNVQSINGSLQSTVLEAVNVKMFQTRVNSENGLGSGFRLSLRPHFLENVGMIPTKICYLMQFLFTSTN